MNINSKLLNFLVTAIILAAWFMYSTCDSNTNEDTPSGDGPEASFTISPENPIVGQVVTLNGTASTGEELTFEWTIKDAPDESSASILITETGMAAIIPDLPGTYEIELCVTDKNDNENCLSKSFDATEQVIIVNAIAGNDTTIDIGEIAPLNGSYSTPYDALLFTWSLLDKPSLSLLTSESITPQFGITAAFYMDEPGVYEVELHVRYKSDENIFNTDIVLLTTNPPEIEDFNPKTGPIGTPVTIEGKNFSSDLAGNTVEFNGVFATITDASDSELTVTVPQGATTGPIKVIIEETGEEVESDDNFVIDGNPGNWSVVLTGVGGLYDVTFVDQNTGIAVGDAGGIYTTSDGGYSWDQASSNTTQNLRGVSFGNSNTCYAVGYYETILKSTDAGYSWNLLSGGTIDYTFNAVCFIDESIGYIAGDNSVLYTEDGGTNWEDRSPSYGGSRIDIFFMDTIGFVVGGGAIFHTENAGITWNHAQSGYYNTTYSGVHFITPYKGWVVGGLVSPLGEAHIAHTVDGGITYNPQPHGVQEELFDVHFVNEHGLVVGANGTILQTSDGGENWQQENAGEPYFLRAVYLFESNAAIVVGYSPGQGGKILRKN
ncbi:MAG: IPT/TIG domain-containing protein [Bacteroidales bacterium]|nr:IPT/TIG domain-containing protein [Bacteroidales bacterium]